MDEGTENLAVEFHYLKNSDFKTFLASGAVSSITPSGFINVNFYLERPPIPDTIIREVRDGVIGKEIGRSSNRKGLIREVNVGLVFDMNTANELVAHLQELVKEFEKYKLGSHGNSQ